jgi:hypothetical protein
MKIIRDTDIAWFAGMFEGEGSITDQSYKRTQISFKSCDYDVIQKLQAVFGFGNITGPYHDRYENHQEYWQIRINKKADVLFILKSIYPYLGIRRKQRIEGVAKRLGVAIMDNTT